MTQLLVIKEQLRNFYQKYDVYIEPVLKFLAALLVFVLLNKNLGYDPRLKSFPIVMALSLFCAFTPSTIWVLLAALVSVGHIYALNPFLAIIAVIVLLILYVLFARFTPKQGYVILAIPVLYLLNLHYAIPILLGLIATPLSIIPISCGVVIYYLFVDIKNAAIVSNASVNVDDILLLYKDVMDTLVNNKEMFLTLFIFAVVLLITYLVRNLQIDHAFETSIFAGGAATILFYLIGDFVVDSQTMLIPMIIGAVLSCAIVFVIQFFRLTLEYSRVEKVQFEDDQYYYYVKAVPKVKVTTPEKSVKHFNKPSEMFGDIDEEEDVPVKVDKRKNKGNEEGHSALEEFDDINEN